MSFYQPLNFVHFCGIFFFFLFNSPFFIANKAFALTTTEKMRVEKKPSQPQRLTNKLYGSFVKNPF